MNAKTIVVGVSGSTAAHPAVDWAVHYAARSGGEVHLERTVDLNRDVSGSDETGYGLLDVDAQLRAEEARASAAEPRVRVRAAVRVGALPGELTAMAAGAGLLVVGSRRESDEAPNAARRRTVRLVAAASSSVVVIPASHANEGTGIVVGVDGSADCAEAVSFAAREADFYGEPLTVVYSWYAPQPWAGSTASSVWPTEPGDEDRAVLSDVIAGIRADYPDVQIVPDLVVAEPALALAHAGKSARMLVVGSRGRHGLTKLLLGSVSEQIVSMLPCPVAVIRPLG